MLFENKDMKAFCLDVVTTELTKPVYIHELQEFEESLPDALAPLPVTPRIKPPDHPKPTVPPTRLATALSPGSEASQRPQREKRQRPGTEEGPPRASDEEQPPGQRPKARSAQSAASTREPKGQEPWRQTTKPLHAKRIAEAEAAQSNRADRPSRSRSPSRSRKGIYMLSKVTDETTLKDWVMAGAPIPERDEQREEAIGKKKVE